MEFYQHVPRTPHHGRVMMGTENASAFKQPTVSFENSKLNTPFPSKSLNNANTPFPAKTGLGGVKTQGLQPRRALADISNANGATANVSASGIKSAAPKTISKTTVKKPMIVKSVRFDEEVDTCTRQSKYRATPYKPEVEQLVKSVSINWYQERPMEDFKPTTETDFSEFSIDNDNVETVDTLVAPEIDFDMAELMI